MPEIFPVTFARSRLMRLVAPVAMALVACASMPLAAQPVVQPLPDPEAKRLNAALTRLARDPRDVAALIEAGEAAMALGDHEAASGFFRRANDTRPGNPCALSGLATALVMSGDPYAAIPIFTEAEKAGADLRAIAADRGLAYDLVGANAVAQEHYRKALANDADGEVRRRLALSLAISGDAAGADEMLLPLLRKQDKPAWRTRTFVLAITGRTREALDVTNTLLPAELAQQIGPYLRYMPQLTPAQQAAAANLGRFPRASEIGRDDPRIGAYASLATPRPKLAAVDAALVPKGDALGSRKRSSRRDQANVQQAREADRKSRGRRQERDRAAGEQVAQAQQDRTAPPDLRPTRELAVADAPSPPVSSSPVPPAAAAASPPAAPMPPSTPQTAAVPAANGLNGAAPAAQSAIAATAPGFDPAARLPGANVEASMPALAAMPDAPAAKSFAQAEPARQLSFAEMFADLGAPVLQVTPVAGAVDVRKIEPARPKPVAEPAKPPPRPAPPTHPSRIWVQLGIGQNMDALKFDWRKFNRQHGTIFKGRKAYVSDLGKTNRLLTGPFESRKAAEDFVAALSKAGLAGPHLWISPAGQVVDSLGE
ncbi:MAG: tetratricopeptide repeat protein [Novosphingobium sp.]|nr:tetratricopeptide repeat protein [Novosphingobium sp.]